MFNYCVCMRENIPASIYEKDLQGGNTFFNGKGDRRAHLWAVKLKGVGGENMTKHNVAAEG